MIPPVDPHTGALPSGRYRTTIEELQASGFVQSSPERQRLFQDWDDATSLLREVIPVCAAWLGGSFISNKDDPNDVDSVFVVDNFDKTALSDADKKLVDAYLDGEAFKYNSGLRVDTSILGWVPLDGPAGPPEAEDYLWTRGYWDDLWSKKRSTTTERQEPNSRHSTVPRVGYLEVIIDGYPTTGPWLA